MTWLSERCSTKALFECRSESRRRTSKPWLLGARLGVAAIPTGYGNWDWDRILAKAWRRPSAFHAALWSGEHLCGLAVGRLSKRRLVGVRHTISVHFIESSHDARHPMRGSVAAFLISAAEAYGRLTGASRIRLIDPLPGIVRLYESHGFTVARKAGQSVDCERRILP